MQGHNDSNPKKSEQLFGRTQPKRGFQKRKGQGQTHKGNQCSVANNRNGFQWNELSENSGESINHNNEMEQKMIFVSGEQKKGG